MLVTSARALSSIIPNSLACMAATTRQSDLSQLEPMKGNAATSLSAQDALLIFEPSNEELFFDTLQLRSACRTKRWKNLGDQNPPWRQPVPSGDEGPSRGVHASLLGPPAPVWNSIQSCCKKKAHIVDKHPTHRWRANSDLNRFADLAYNAAVFVSRICPREEEESEHERKPVKFMQG